MIPDAVALSPLFVGPGAFLVGTLLLIALVFVVARVVLGVAWKLVVIGALVVGVLWIAGAVGVGQPGLG